MPANRSRTQNWRRSLEQVRERGGTVEIAVVGEGDHADADRLMWRVRVLDVGEHGLVVEQPFALGRSITIRSGTTLVGVMTIGQNRWRFDTACEGTLEVNENGRAVSGVRLTEPQDVRRCQRRSHARVATNELQLPRVEMWPLMDPASVVLAERASQLACKGDGVVSLEDEARLPDDTLLPEVGPRFEATLTNIGGGGLGVDAAPDQATALSRHKLFWLRFHLPPAVSGPICATAKLAHTRLQSNQHVHAGLAFDFSFHPEHRQFVTDQIERYIDVMQGRSAA